MSEFNDLFEEMLNDYLPEEKKPGDIVEAVIVRKDNDFGYLDLSGKQEGRILIREIEDFNIGDTIEVKVLRNDEENVIVSKFLLDKAKEFVDFSEGETVTGTIFKKIKGGYSVKVSKNEGFLPFSLSSFERNNDHIGEKFKFIIKEKTRNGLTLSRTDLIKKEEEGYLKSINIGDTLTGEVKKVLDFRIIVNLGVTTGFIHISELGWHHGADALKNYKEGDKIEAKVIDIDNEKKSVKLSVKQLSENPWNSVKEKYKIGDILEKDVSEVFEFGLLIELEKDIEGLLHVSDLAYRRVSNLNSKYKKGDVIKFKIIGFNDEKNRLSLSAKALFDDMWDKIEELYNVGDVVKGKVVNVQEYGIFLEIREGVEVFIHKNEFSWDRNENIKFKVGDEVEFKIISLDKNEKKIGGSIKQLTVSPWKEAAEQYKIGNKVKVPIVEIQENGVLVKLTDRFNGMVPKKELTDEFLKDISEKFSVGDEVEAVITETNEKRKSIILSVKKIKEIEDKKELEELMKIYGV